MKKETKDVGQLLAYWTISIWQTYPATMAMLQRQRDEELKKDSSFIGLPAYRGLNSTIVFLSASCIEGFLCECLLTFWSRLHPKEDMQKRMMHHFNECAINATFNDYPALFELATGKSLKEHMDGKPLRDAVIALINLRNGIAHAKSPVYYNYHNIQTSKSTFRIEGNYEEAKTYLIKQGLMTETGDIFTGEIADHFAIQVKQYVDDVMGFLPDENAKQMMPHIKTAFGTASQMGQLVKVYQEPREPIS